MPVFRTKHREVQAFRAMTRTILLTTAPATYKDKREVVEAGDWIVTEDGKQFPVRDQEFRGRYEAFDDTGMAYLGGDMSAGKKTEKKVEKPKEAPVEDAKGD